MTPEKKVLVKRSPMDRRSPVDRRVYDLGPGEMIIDRRTGRERRLGWEDRYGWERTSRWSSAPIFPEIP